MMIMCRKVGDIVVLDCSGKLHGLGEKDLLDHLPTLAGASILVNLAGVTRISATGIGDLVQAYTATTNSGGKLKLLNPARAVIAPLRITTLDRIFEIFEDESEAIQSFA